MVALILCLIRLSSESGSLWCSYANIFLCPVYSIRFFQCSNNSFELCHCRKLYENMHHLYLSCYPRKPPRVHLRKTVKHDDYNRWVMDGTMGVNFDEVLNQNLSVYTYIHAHRRVKRKLCKV